MKKATAGTSAFTVRSNEVDYHGQATLPALVSYMQEAAWDNTATLGISMYELLDRGLTWVLQRLRIEMFRYPGHKESITVETWASGRERVFLHRDFRIYSEAGELLGQATSVWLVMDVVKRQMVSVPDFIMQVEVVPGQEPLPFAKGKLPTISEAVYTLETPVRWHDIDLNKHVTNTRYLQWVLETLPVTTPDQNQLQELDIIFKAESIMGDVITGQAAPATQNATYLHKLTSTSTGKELVQAQSKWRVRN